MLHNKVAPLTGALAVLAALAACDKMTSDAPGAKQTAFPGQVSAGGGTGGEVMAKNGRLEAKKDVNSSPVLVPAKPAGSSGNPGSGSGAAASGAGAAGTAGGKPSGTPGIPEGSGGNVSGAQMGGTTPAAAGSKTADGVPTGTAAADELAKKAKEQQLAEQQKQKLEASMEAVAARWRERASTRGWKPDTSGASGLEQGQTETSAMGLPAVIRSEKFGTAPPSEDVKQPAKDPSN